MCNLKTKYQFSRSVVSNSLQPPWTAAHQPSLSITNSQSLFKLMSIESVMPSKHLILCHPLLLCPSIFSSIRVFSNESVLCIRWPKYWSFSFSISPSNEYSGLISFATLWTVAHQAPLPMGFFRKNTDVGCHALLQGSFPTQGSKPCLLHLLHCRWILYH